MAEKNIGRTARLEDGFLSDDDPLAELAHIVGYVPKPAQEPAAPARPVRREPEFDLEEELMREFERFDSPVVLPTYRQTQPDVPPRPVFEPEKLAAPEPRFDVRQSLVTPAAAVEPVFAEEPVIPAEPVNLAEQEIEFQPDSAPAPFVDAEDTDEPVFALADDDLFAEFGSEEPSFAGAPVPDLSDFGLDLEEQPEEVAEPDLADELNLADELDLSLSSFVPEMPAQTKQAAPVSPFAEWKTDRLEGTPIAKAADSANAPFDLDWAPQPVPASVVKEVIAPVARAPIAHAAPAISRPPAATIQKNYGIDDLLAEVERYPVVPMPRSNPVLATPVAKPAAPAYSAPVAEMPPLFEPVMFEEPKAPVAAPQVSVAARSAFLEPIVDIDANAAVNPFDESAFELDLDSIELEIADSVPEIKQAAAPHSAPRKAEDFSLHFDPDQISEMPDMPESIVDMQVPTLPVIEKEKPAVVHPDHYIENEVDDLFGVPPQPKHSADDLDDDFYQWGEPHHRTAGTDDDERINARLEEFERELEEDFRRSLSDTPADYFAMQANAAARMERPVKRARARKSGLSSRGLLLAASVAVIAILGAGGVYAWLQSGSTNVAASGEPRVILADKEPMKVVPEDKGGKTVPNQDKAVYDQVAGTAKADPKQEALVSSSEEPVDVVQKTLIPEGLALDTTEESAGTPTEDTQDGRLLPDPKADTAAATDAANNAQPVGVSPRKVKTMVVRPDGTLVARDESTPTPAPAAAPTQADAGPAMDAAVSPPGANGDQGSSAKTDMSVTDAAPVADPAAPSDSIADAANAQVDAVAPVRKVKTTVVAPVPTARPSDQPVNVVGTVTDQGNVKAETKAKPVEVAAATPANSQANSQATLAAEAPAAPAQTAAVSAGTYVMQVASLPSEEEAKRAYANLAKKFGSVISGKPLDIRKAAIAGKGTFYRVRVVAGSKADAVALCEKYRGVGGSCIVSQ